MNKFWNFEKESVVEFMADRPELDMMDILSEKETLIIERDLKYGTLEYLGDTLRFNPEKDDANVILVTLLLGDSEPKVLLKELLAKIRTPFSIAVDFWCISDSFTRGEMVLYPSFGTRYNKKTYMKWDHHVEELIESFDTKHLNDQIYKAHASARPTLSRSGVQVKRVVSMWVRLSKSKIRML